MLLSSLGALGGAGCAAASDAEADPAAEAPFRFGLLTDVQYADKDSVGARRYRDSLVALASCVEDLAGRDLAFVVQGGDLIDGREAVAESEKDLARVLSLLDRLPCVVHHVLGNHGLSIPRAELMPRLGLTRGYYSFVHGRWRFLVADAFAVSTCGTPPEDPGHRAAVRWLRDHGDPEHPNAQPWNGGLGEEQREWLRAELRRAAARGQHAVVFCHLPVLAEASTPHHLLWDHEEVLAILDAAPTFTAWINGHDHGGGFATRAGRSFLTVPAMVEADPAVNAYAVVEVHSDRLEIQGFGTVPSRTVAAAPDFPSP